jgi:F-type H+-transporting ATPase subunit b
MKTLTAQFRGRQPLCVALVVGLGLLAAISCFGSEGGEAAGHAHGAAQLKDFGWRVLNFSILAAILAWAIKKANVKGLLAARQEGVEKALREAAEARAAAESKLAEYTEKLEKATSEIDAIYSSIKLETEAEKNRILAEARAAAERIKEQSAAAAEQEIQKARKALREEAARLSVQLATEKLQQSVMKTDQDRFINEFIDDYLTKVEKAH